jgi:hypothetical protein
MRPIGGPPPNYHTIEPDGSRGERRFDVAPTSQMVRAQNGQIVAGSRNGLHSGTMNLLPAPGPWATRPLATGTAPLSATSTAPYPGVQKFLPLGRVSSARPQIIEPD